MPELPEVETIRLGLQQYLVGKTIERVEVRLSKMMSGDTASIIGSKIKEVRRFGKGLVIDFHNNFSLAIHIKMTGQLIYEGKDRPTGELSDKVGGMLPNAHTHIIFDLEKGTRLYYNDIRQFGWMKIVRTDEVFDLPFFKELGPEPIPSAGQRSLTIEQFKAILQKAKGPIKPLLMDQKKIGGIGNIYANDSLFLAKISPLRKANTLTDKEAEKLFEEIIAVLKKSLSVGGASEWQYVNALGQAGKYQDFFQVYGRVGKPCVVCKTTIVKIVMAGRGTFYCPSCQA